jgi:hypothetical protein
MKDRNSDILIYQAEDGEINIEVNFIDETVWLSIKQMASLFNVDRSVVTKHIQNIYKDKELSKDSTCAFFAQVQKEGNRSIKREIAHYNLDIIISVGYRVNSIIGTKFRIWATTQLKQHILKGYTINKHWTGNVAQINSLVTAFISKLSKDVVKNKLLVKKNSEKIDKLINSLEKFVEENK